MTCGGGEFVKPTVIGSLPAGTVQDHAAFDTERPAESSAGMPTIRPTVIGTSSAATPFALAEPVPSPHRTVDVSRIPGTRREVLQLDWNELRAAWPDASQELLNEVMSQGALVFPEALDRSYCEQWGQSEQQEFSRALNDALACAGHSSVRGAQRHLSRLRELLNEVVELFDESGLGWFRKRNLRARLDELMGELAELKPLLLKEYEVLQGVRRSHDEVMARMFRLHRVLQAQVLLADRLLERVAPAVRPVLLNREGSLAQTVNLLQQQCLLNEQSSRDLDRLSSTVHHAVWVQWPMWNATVAALPAGDLSDTQRYLLKDGVQSFLHHIHGT
jgi:hypothetical protein